VNRYLLVNTPPSVSPIIKSMDQIVRSRETVEIPVTFKMVLKTKDEISVRIGCDEGRVQVMIEPHFLPVHNIIERDLRLGEKD
jgi:hypothetical protein